LLATATPERVESLRARFSFIPGQSFDLTYRENRGEANAVAQTYEITFAMPPPEGLNLLPGMTAMVEIALKPTHQGLPDIRIPTVALVAQARRKDGFFVWRYEPATGMVSKVPVTVGQLGGEGVPVLSGLAEGDLIVTSGSSQLQEGMSVRPLGDSSTAL
jgi:multidrug efflux pump subunit AcrA (membrane-fusion protein)